MLIIAQQMSVYQEARGIHMDLLKCRSMYYQVMMLERVWVKSVLSNLMCQEANSGLISKGFEKHLET